MQIQIHSKVSSCGVPVNFQAEKETLVEIDIVTLWHAQSTLIHYKGALYILHTGQC